MEGFDGKSGGDIFQSQELGHKVNGKLIRIITWRKRLETTIDKEANRINTKKVMRSIM